jgi:hypothetical protein
MSEITDNTQPQGATPSQPSPDSTPAPDNQSQSSLFQRLMQNQIAPAPAAANPDQPAQPNQQNPAPPVTSSPGHPVISGTGDPLANHPAVKHASVLHKVAETLAGGPKTITTFDPNTGQRIETKQPLTNKQILMGALANILGTLGNAAEGFSAGMQHRAPRPAQPLPTQAADQQQAQQADQDFEKQQNMRVRQAKVMTANLEAMRLSYAMRHEEDSALDQVIANHKDDLDNWTKSGAVEASNIPSSELLSKGYDRSKYTPIADGRVPVFDKNTGQRVVNKDGVPVSELSYSVVDATTQAPLTQEKYDQLARYGLMQTKEGFKLPEGATISSAQLALLNNKLGLIQQTQRELDEVHDAVGAPKVDLASEIKKNKGVLSALEAFHNGSATEDNPGQQIAAMAAGNNRKAKNAVGIITNLFGTDNLSKFAARNQQAPEKMSLEDAKQILADPRTDPHSNAAKTAQGVLNLDRQQAAQKAAAETTARVNAEAAATPASQGLSVPKGFTSNPNAPEMSADDLRQDLQSKGVKVPSNFEALYAVAHNAADLKTLPTRTAKGTNQMDAQTGLSFIRQYLNPQYQEGDYAAASGLSKELASTRQGTAGGSLLSAGVASNHLDLLASAGDALKNQDTQVLNQIANKLGVAVGKSPAVTFSAIADQVNAEVGKTVAGGAPHEAELAKLAQNLNTDQSPEQISNVVRAYVNLMSGRVNEINERSQQYFGRDVKGISAETAKVFAKYGVAVPGYVQVKINGQSGVIPKSKLGDFRKQYPNAEVQQ